MSSSNMKTIFVRKGEKGRDKKLEISVSSTIADVLEKARKQFKIEDDVKLVAEFDGMRLEDTASVEDLKEKSSLVIKTKDITIEKTSGEKITVSIPENITDVYDLVEVVTQKFEIDEDVAVILSYKNGNALKSGDPVSDIPNKSTLVITEEKEEVDTGKTFQVKKRKGKKVKKVKKEETKESEEEDTNSDVSEESEAEDKTKNKKLQKKKKNARKGKEVKVKKIKKEETKESEEEDTNSDESEESKAEDKTKNKKLQKKKKNAKGKEKEENKEIEALGMKQNDMFGNTNSDESKVSEAEDKAKKQKTTKEEKK